MKITILQLRNLIRETLYKTLNESDAHRVTYTAKDGKRETRVFPNKKIADMYAKNVKNAVVEPVDIDVADVDVQKVAPASLEDQRQSSKKFFDQTIAGQKYDPRGVSPSEEARGEDEFADIYRAAIMSGMSSEDAWKEVDYAKRQRRHY